MCLLALKLFVCLFVGQNHYPLRYMLTWFLFLFGHNADLVLSNKLVTYDLENQTIGWAEYNCEYHTLCLLLCQLFSLVIEFLYLIMEGEDEGLLYIFLVVPATFGNMVA